MNSNDLLLRLRLLREFCEDITECSNCPIKNSCREYLKTSMFSFMNMCVDEVKDGVEKENK